MPATSQAQRRFFGWAEHNPEEAKREGKYPKGMTRGQMHDFAATPEKGLPRRKVYGEDGMPPVQGAPTHGAEGHDTYRAKSGGQVLVDRPGHEWHRMEHGVVESAGELPRKMYAEDGGHWMQGAVKRPGALTAKATRAGMSPMSFARKHYRDSGLTGQEARFAVNAQK